MEAFKTRHNNKPFTLTHCWTIINNCPKFKDQYRELQRKRGLKTAKFAGGGDGEALKRPRGKTNSKVDDIRDASSMALHDTLHVMMSQKDVRDEKKRQSKERARKRRAYHVPNAETTHGPCFNALKCGAILVALLLDEQPPLLNRADATVACNLVGVGDIPRGMTRPGV